MRRPAAHRRPAPCPQPHIRWDEGRITIIASKTEHHVGREEREIPIFPELKPLLLEARKLASSKARYVITRYRDPASNLRTQFLRILDAAGVAPWPKLFQNLRSTRQTELTEHFPAHVVCAWLGNTEKIAQGHYLQVTPAHFDRAIGANTSDLSDGRNDDGRGDDGGGNDDSGGSGGEDGSCGGRSRSGAKSGAAHAGLASHGAAPGSEAVSIKADAAAACEITRAAADICNYVDMGAAGFEPAKAEPSDLQSDPFVHFGTRPLERPRLVRELPGASRDPAVSPRSRKFQRGG